MDTGLSSGGRAEKCYGGGGCGGVIRTYVTVGQAGGRIELLLFRDCRSSATGESQVRQMNGGHGKETRTR